MTCEGGGRHRRWCAVFYFDLLSCGRGFFFFPLFAWLWTWVYVCVRIGVEVGVGVSVDVGVGVDVGQGGCLLESRHPTNPPPPLPSRHPKFWNPSFSNSRFWGKLLAPKAPDFFFWPLEGYPPPPPSFHTRNNFWREFKMGEKHLDF